MTHGAEVTHLGAVSHSAEVPARELTWRRRGRDFGAIDHDAELSATNLGAQLGAMVYGTEPACKITYDVLPARRRRPRAGSRARRCSRGGRAEEAAWGRPRCQRRPRRAALAWCQLEQAGGAPKGCAGAGLEEGAQGERGGHVPGKRRQRGGRQGRGRTRATESGRARGERDGPLRMDKARRQDLWRRARRHGSWRRALVNVSVKSVCGLDLALWLTASRRVTSAP
jgi:hypothetical protein